MLKITQTQDATGASLLILEGRLLGPWVAELQTAVASIPPQTVQLDLAGVRFVDAEGLALLCRLEEQGARLLRASPFVQEAMGAMLLGRNSNSHFG